MQFLLRTPQAINKNTLRRNYIPSYIACSYNTFNSSSNTTVIHHHRLSISRPFASPATLPTLSTTKPTERRQSSTTVCRVYTSPEVYDIAFSFRDFDQETAFMLAMYKEYSEDNGAKPLRNFLELGCGPARHAVLLTKQTNCHSICLDSSKEMLDYAASRAAKESDSIDTSRLVFVQNTMAAEKGYTDRIATESVDFAAIMLGTMSHNLTNKDAVQCFHNLAQVVRPGGLLLLELGHPDELYGGSFLSPDDYVDAWEASEESEPHRRVLVEWGRDGDEFSTVTAILKRTVGLSVFNEQGEMIDSNVEVVPQRQYGLNEIEILGLESGFEQVAVFGDFDKKIDIDHVEAYRAVVCFRKK